MVQLLAQLCGQQLHILPMNTSMDTTELLGGFEQVCFTHFINLLDIHFVDTEFSYLKQLCILNIRQIEYLPQSPAAVSLVYNMKNHPVIPGLFCAHKGIFVK